MKACVTGDDLGRAPELARRSAVVLLFAVVIAAGCSKPGNYNPVSPSAVMPTELASNAGGTTRHYVASITGGPLTAGAVGSLTVTFTNCDAATCPTNPTTASQGMASAEIVVPAGFEITAIGTPTATGGKSWKAVPKDSGTIDGTIRLGANQGNQRLYPGESVAVTLTVRAPSTCGVVTWLTNAYQDALTSLNELVRTTKYEIGGAQPQVEVTGCVVAAGCTRGQGYWKNHSEAWPVSSVTLGTTTYTAAQLLAIFGQPVAGNGLVQLAHQLIAAKLNVASGASTPPAVATGIVAADALIGGLVVPPVGSGALATSATSALNTLLDNYNSGIVGPGACTP